MSAVVDTNDHSSLLAHTVVYVQHYCTTALYDISIAQYATAAAAA